MPLAASGAAAPRRSALAGLVALLRLVDDVDAALATNQLVVTMAAAQRLERVADLHRRAPKRMGWEGARAKTPLLTVLKRSRPSIACLRRCQRGSKDTCPKRPLPRMKRLSRRPCARR